METMKTLTIGNNTYDITDDGAIRFDSAQSLTKTQQAQVIKNIGAAAAGAYVTPEMYGAVGDGVTDDSEAFTNAILSGYKVVCNSTKTYYFANSIDVRTLSQGHLDGNNAYFVNFHLYVNLNDDFTDWRHAFQARRFIVENMNFGLRSGGWSKIPDGWETPLITTGAPMIIRNIVTSYPYVLATVDEYIDFMQCEAWTCAINWDLFAQYEISLDAISCLNKSGEYCRFDGSIHTSAAGDGWNFKQCNEFYSTQYPEYKMMRVTNRMPIVAESCIQCAFIIDIYSKAAFIGCHWEGCDVTFVNNYLVKVSFLNCFFYNNHVINNNKSTIYQNCFFRATVDAPKSYTLADTTGNVSFYDMECVLENCSFGGSSLIDTKILQGHKHAPKKTYNWRAISYRPRLSEKTLTVSSAGNPEQYFPEVGEYTYDVYLRTTSIPDIAVDYATFIASIETIRSKATMSFDFANGGFSVVIIRTSPNGSMFKTEFFANPNELDKASDWLRIGFGDFGAYAEFGLVDGRPVYPMPWIPISEKPTFTINEVLYEANGALVTSDGSDASVGMHGSYQVNKPESPTVTNSVLYTAQSLSKEQQAQARTNLGILDEEKYYPSLSTAITDINNGVNTNVLTDVSAAKVKVFTAENGRLTVMLLDDISESTQITINKDIDLVLNGKTLTFTAAGAVLEIATDIVCNIYGDVPGSTITKEGFTASSIDLIKASAGTLHFHGGIYAIEESKGTTTTLTVSGTAKVTADNFEIVSNTKDEQKYYSFAIKMSSSEPLVLRDSKISAFGTSDTIACYTRAAVKATRCTFEVNGKRNCHAFSTVSGIAAGTEMILEDCEFYSTTHDMTAAGSATHYIARGITQTGGILKAKNCKIMGDAWNNDADDETCSMGVVVSNSDSVCFLEDCYVFGTMNGVHNNGKLYVYGGTFTGHSHGGFYFIHGADGEAFVKDAVIRCGNYEGIFPEYYATDGAYDNLALTGFYVGGSTGSNTTVYIDGCTIGEPGKTAFAIRGTSGEQNCTVNISNSTIVDGALPIRVDNATHKLNIGIGTNITTDKIDNPQWAEFTGKNYRRYHSSENVDGYGYDVVRKQVEATVSDDWFEIADITTTEEVKSIYVNTDKNGNSFECKEIVAQMILPAALTGTSSGEWFSGGPEYWNPPSAGNNASNAATYRYYRMRVVKGMYAEMISAYNTTANFWGDLEHVRIIRSEDNTVANYPRGFFVERSGDETNVYPVGTKLKIWGLRA